MKSGTQIVKKTTFEERQHQTDDDMKNEVEKQQETQRTVEQLQEMEDTSSNVNK